MFIDTHAHIHVKDFDTDRAAVIERARASGIGKLINVGFDVEGNFQALALAKKYDFIYATMGIHPHLASEWNDDVAKRIHDAVICERTARARRPTSAGLVGSRARKAELIKIVALGEMGLDYYKNFQPQELQKKVFREQARLAKKLDLPVIIHCRDAFKDAFAILDEEKIERALLHCFTGTAQEAQEGLKRGYFLAFTGIITYASAAALRDVVALIPLDRIFCETDCPFLAPQKYRGKRNEPAFVEEIYKKVAAIKKIPLKNLEQDVEENLKKLFGI